jgi:hypothetical protein
MKDGRSPVLSAFGEVCASSQLRHGRLSQQWHRRLHLMLITGTNTGVAVRLGSFIHPYNSSLPFPAHLGQSDDGSLEGLPRLSP